MEINKQQSLYSYILSFLELSYVGAKDMDDLEIKERIARAIVAFESDLSEDIFTEEFMENFI